MSRRKKAPVEREWQVRMRVTFDGATAFVTAATEEEARAKADACDWSDLDTTCASMVDWGVTGGPEPNE